MQAIFVKRDVMINLSGKSSKYSTLKFIEFALRYSSIFKQIKADRV